MILHRIPTGDIEKTMRHGNQFHASHVFFSVRRNNIKPSINRFAFIVSTKVDKRAVVRNVIRRRLKEIVRNNFDAVQKGYDIVCIARKSAIGIQYEELERNVRSLIKKSNLS